MLSLLQLAKVTVWNAAYIHSYKSPKRGLDGVDERCDVTTHPFHPLTRPPDVCHPRSLGSHTPLTCRNHPFTVTTPYIYLTLMLCCLLCTLVENPCLQSLSLYWFCTASLPFKDITILLGNK